MKVFGYYLPFLKRVLAAITALLALVILHFEPTPLPEFHESVAVTDFMLFDALVRGQGVTNDGKNLYFSWNFGLTKTDLSGTKILKQNLVAIPFELLLKGCSHIGGIGYYDGRIFCTMEDSKVFENLYIASFDAKNLKLIKYKAVPLEDHEFGIPWCAVDPATGYVYSARRDRITTLNIYDPDTLELIDYLELDAPVHKAQGGEVHDGVLYLSMQREEQAIYAIHLATGQVQKVFDRFLGGAEGEGMTILPMANGAFFHALDVGELGVNVHLRSYAFDPASLVWGVDNP